MPIYNDRGSAVHPAEDIEVPGILYNSHTASKGQVVWYSVIEPREHATIVVSIPEHLAADGLYDRLEAIAQWLVREHAAPTPAPRPPLKLVR